MNKPLKIVVMVLLMLVAKHVEVSAQVTFTIPGAPSIPTDFTVDGVSVQSGRAVAISPARTVNFSVTLYRSNSSNDGYVNLWAGNASGTLVTRLTNNTNRLPPWTSPNSDGVSYKYVTGQFSTSAIGPNTVIYAVFYNDNSQPFIEATSAGIPLVPGVTTPTGPVNPGPTTPPVQCVANGTAPQLLRSGFDAPATKGSRIRWEYSYDDINYFPVPGMQDQVNLQPPATFRTTYYIAHREGRNCGFLSVFNCSWIPLSFKKFVINTSTPPATPTENIYSVCGGSSFVINVVPEATASSYNWSLPDADWRVDGQQAVTGQSVYTTTAANVTITPPVSIAPGTYELRTSSNGGASCGGNAGYGSIYVTIVSSPPGPIEGPFFAGSTYYGTSQGYFHLVMPAVSYATSYTVTIHNVTTNGIYNPSTGLVTFYLYQAWEPDGIYVHIVASNGCGNSSFMETLILPVEPSYKLNSKTSSVDQSTPVYPNPANNEIVINSIGVDKITFIDTYGITHKVILFDNSRKVHVVNIHNLPNGLYQMIIEGKGTSLIKRHILIEH